MGHTRLGAIPKSRPWRAVVAAFAGATGGSGAGAEGGAGSSEGEYAGAARREAVLLRADVAAIADQTLQAARGGLERAKNDPGLLYTVYLLTQVALASREPGWRRRLVELGIQLDADATLFDLSAEFQGAVDDWLVHRRHRSDVTEMAQRAAGEALTALVTPRAQTLFGESGEELRLAVRTLSSKAGFADLGHAFFGRFMSGFLNFYLSRVSAAQLGEGPLQQVGDITAFNQALATHCWESARIVRDFAGQWYSKTEYERGISFENTGGFVAVALAKMQEELRLQREGVVQHPGARDQGTDGQA